MNTNNPPFQKENLYVKTDKNKKYYAVGFINKKDFILSKVFFIIYCFIVALSTYLAMDLKNILILI